MKCDICNKDIKSEEAIRTSSGYVLCNKCVKKKHTNRSASSSEGGAIRG